VPGETEHERKLRDTITKETLRYFDERSKQMLAQKGEPIPE